MRETFWAGPGGPWDDGIEVGLLMRCDVMDRFATAYAITKALLPVRLVFSVWATPWFARVAVGPAMNGFRRLFRRKGKVTASASAAAGTGAVGTGVVAKEAPGTVGPVKTAVGVGRDMEKGAQNPP